jgi:hypothetical protein
MTGFRPAPGGVLDATLAPADELARLRGHERAVLALPRLACPRLELRQGRGEVVLASRGVEDQREASEGPARPASPTRGDALGEDPGDGRRAVREPVARGQGVELRSLATLEAEPVRLPSPRGPQVDRPLERQGVVDGGH